MLVPRDRQSPADRGIVPFDVFQGVPTRPLVVPKPSTDDDGASLKEVAVSAMLELQDKHQQEEEEERVESAKIASSSISEIQYELWLRAQGASSSAACAVAMPGPV